MISIPGRIPIQIHPFFWLLVALIGWLNSPTLTGIVIWVVVIFISILIHEFGHALTALAFGQTASISLVGFGGVTQRDGPAITRLKEFLIVLNGPLAGFTLLFVIIALLPFQTSFPWYINYALQAGVQVNFYWTILNLIPVLPLDGGQLLRICLEGAFGLKGLKTALIVSVVLGGLLGVYAMFIHQIFISVIFIMMAIESYKSWTDVKDMHPIDSDQTLQKKLTQGIDALKRGKNQDALTEFVFIRQQAPKGSIYVTATEYAARILAEQGQYKQAYEWLAPLQNRLSVDYLNLLHQLAYRIQEWEAAIKIGQAAYQKNPSYEIALINSLCHAIMGQTQPAVGWLRCSIQQGLPSPQTIIQKREFDVIRETQDFKILSKTLKN